MIQTIGYNSMAARGPGPAGPVWLPSWLLFLLGILTVEFTSLNGSFAPSDTPLLIQPTMHLNYLWATPYQSTSDAGFSGYFNLLRPNGSSSAPFPLSSRLTDHHHALHHACI